MAPPWPPFLLLLSVLSLSLSPLSPSLSLSLHLSVSDSLFCHLSPRGCKQPHSSRFHPSRPAAPPRTSLTLPDSLLLPFLSHPTPVSPSHFSLSWVTSPPMAEKRNRGPGPGEAAEGRGNRAQPSLSLCGQAGPVYTCRDGAGEPGSPETGCRDGLGFSYLPALNLGLPLKNAAQRALRPLPWKTRAAKAWGSLGRGQGGGPNPSTGGHGHPSMQVPPRWHLKTASLLSPFSWQPGNVS